MNSSLKLRRSRSRSAFTMLEIMLVLMIIVLLLGFAVNKMSPSITTAQKVRIQADFQTLRTALVGYQMNGGLPTTEQGLKALVHKPESEPRPRNWNKLMDSLPRDPFGNEYGYVQPGVHNPDSFDLFSLGKDGKPGTADDFGNWEQDSK